MESPRYYSHVLIIGSGLAGCSAALTLADQGCEVSLLTPLESLDGGNSERAQGGIVFSANREDQRALEKDMYIAGHRYNFGKAVRYLATQGGEAVQNMLVDRLHVPFDRNPELPDRWDFTLEGGHSAPRIVHCADYTGKAIMEALHVAVLQHPRVRVLAQRSAVDLITTEHHATIASYRYHLRNQCVGAYVLNNKTLQVEPHLADLTVLATGGVSAFHQLPLGHRYGHFHGPACGRADHQYGVRAIPSYCVVPPGSAPFSDYRSHARRRGSADQHEG